MTDKQNDKYDDFNFGSNEEIVRSFEEMLDEEESISVPTDDYDFDFEESVKVNVEDTYIEMHHAIGNKTINLRYCGRAEEITIYSEYTQDEFAFIYPHIDTRVISSITSVFIDLRYYGHDFYSGDFEAILRNWLEEYVFNGSERTNVEMTKYLIEKETKTLFKDLSNARLHKCILEYENHKFTPLTWASPEEIKKRYDWYASRGYYK